MKRRILISAGILFFLAAAAYWSALGNPLLYDDEALLLGNRMLTWSRLGSLGDRDYFGFFPGQPVSWRPLSVLSYIVNRSVWGEWYAGWRLIYLAGHIVNAVLLMLLFSRLGFGAGASLAGAALFLLHPVHSEVINEVSYNEEIMATGFLLLSALFLAVRESKGWLWAALPAAGYLAALLSKESALLFPLVAACWLLSDRCRRVHARRQEILILGNLGLVMALYSLVRFGLMTNPLDKRVMVFSAKKILEGGATFLRLLADYMGRFLWPFNLSAIYNISGISWADPRVAAGAALLLTILMLAVWGLLRGRMGLAVPGVWFLCGMAILLYNIPLADRKYAFDHYLYLPSVGLVWYAVETASWLSGKAGLSKRAGQAAAAIMLAALVSICLPVVWSRNRVWSGGISLWRDTEAKAPLSPVAHSNLGLALYREGRTAEAEAQFRESIRILPGYDVGHYNLGMLLAGRGLLDAAAEQYQEAVDDNPDLAEAWNGLGYVMGEKNLADKAEEYYARSIRAKPDYYLAHFNLGNVLMKRGSLQEAEASYRRCISLAPAYLGCRRNLGVVLIRRGKLAEAAAEYRIILRMDPRDVTAHYNLGVISAKQGNNAEAQKHFLEAQRLKSDTPR